MAQNLNTPYGNVPYDERPGSPQEAYQQQAYRVVRTFDVAWADRWTFLLGLMGDATVGVFAGTNGYISRNVPTGYQTRINDGSHADQWMWPSSVDSIEPLGTDQGVDANGVAQYAKCRITVSYEAQHYKVLSDDDMLAAGYTDIANPAAPAEWTLARFCSVFTQPTAEYLGLPLGTMTWVEINDLANFDPATGFFKDPYTPTVGGFIRDDGKTYPGTPVTNSVGRIIAASEINITLHMSPKIPSAAYTAIGTINQATMTDAYGRFPDAPAGTLLLTNVEVKPYRWVGGKFLYDISYKMKYFNPKPGPGDPGYVEVNPGTLNPVGSGNTPQITHNHFLHYRNVTGFAGYKMPPVYRFLTNDGVDPSAGDGFPAGVATNQLSGVPLYRNSDFTKLFRAV